MCCTIPIEEESRDLSRFRDGGVPLLPVRILARPDDGTEAAETRAAYPVLSRRVNDRPVVYLDNACMSLRPRPVIDAVTRYYEEYSGCSGRVDHAFGTATTRACQAARESVQRFIGAAHPSEVLFVRNTTEAINVVAASVRFGHGEAVLCSDIEHNSNLLPWQALRQRRGVEHRIFATTPDTEFDLETFEAQLDERVRLVSVLLTSNLTGVTFPIAEIVRRAHRVGALVLVDAAQGMLHHEIDVRRLDVDFLAFSGHKMLGPTGCGVLYARRDLLDDMPPFLLGGETVTDTTYTGHTLGPAPDRFEAGLQDYAGIIGLGAAVDYIEAIGRPAIRRRVDGLAAAATDELAHMDRVQLLGPTDGRRRSGILNFTVDGLSAADVAFALDRGANIMTRSGKHCVHSWYNARGVPDSVRASLAFYNTQQELDFFLWTLRDVVRLYAA